MSNDDLRAAENRALRRDRDYWKRRAKALARAWEVDWLRHDLKAPVFATDLRDLAVQSVESFIIAGMDEVRGEDGEEGA